jgi:hypothetical protein
MSEIRVRMACECVVTVEASGTDAPRCVAHEETRVRAVQAPAPRIVAVNCEASGPHVRRA